jgi:hypothetical protein
MPTKLDTKELIMHLVGKLTAAHEEIGSYKNRQYEFEALHTALRGKERQISDMTQVIQNLEKQVASLLDVEVMLNGNGK